MINGLIKNIKKNTHILFCIFITFSHFALSQPKQEQPKAPGDFESLSLPEIQTGDIIFQESQSSQAAAIKEVTQSEWTHVGVIVEKTIKGKSSYFVFEAIKTVRYTPLLDFIKRGKNSKFVIKRVDPLLFSAHQDNFDKLIQALEVYKGRNYDELFEWGDKLIYCSELVFKGYENGFSIKTGIEQKFSDLKLDGPAASKLKKAREAKYGKTVNPNETIVTPASMFHSSNLVVVFDSETFIKSEIKN